MSAGQQGNQSSSSGTWTEPPWSGWIETTGDALLILEAARRGLIPRVTRRLVDSERKMITSGSVFVFDEDESGIKRWTDGFFWSPSRILGNFLLYRETDKRGAGHRGARNESENNDQIQYNDAVKLEVQGLSRPKSETSHLGVNKHKERILMGSLTNSYKFKPDGLMKKTFSLTIGGVAQHLISYYKIEDVENGRLRSPSSLPELASLDISPEYLDKTHFRNPPKVEIGVDGLPRYRGEADDIETSPSLLTAPLSSAPPLLSDERVEGSSSNKRVGKRYDPYPNRRTPKRINRSDPPENEPETASPQTPSPTTPQLTPQQPTQPNFPDTNTAAAPPAQPPYAVPNYYQPPGYAMPPPPPPPHMYAQPSYPPPSPQHPHPQQPIMPSTPQYSYYQSPPGPPGTESVQGMHQVHPYYPYYHHPHAPPYSSYPNVAWPHYAGYPPQPIPQHQPIPVSADDSQKSAEGEGLREDRSNP